MDLIALLPVYQKVRWRNIAIVLNRSTERCTPAIYRVVGAQALIAQRKAPRISFNSRSLSTLWSHRRILTVQKIHS